MLQKVAYVHERLRRPASILVLYKASYIQTLTIFAAMLIYLPLNPKFNIYHASEIKY